MSQQKTCLRKRAALARARAEVAPPRCADGSYVPTSIDDRRCSICWAILPLADDHPPLTSAHIRALRDHCSHHPLVRSDRVIELLDEIDRLQRELDRRGA